MSPRKSSTSSGNRFERPRYLLVEAPGAGTLSPPSFEALLAARLPSAPGGRLRFRVIRSEGRHALVAVAHTEVEAARSAWNAPERPGVPGLRTLRSYGTLRKGKEWLVAHYRPPRPVPDRPRNDRDPRRRR